MKPIKYIKYIICKFCCSPLTIEIKTRDLNRHGFIKRKCPFCKKTWRISQIQAFKNGFIE